LSYCIEDYNGWLYRRITKLEQMTKLLKAMQEMMETQIGTLISQVVIHQDRVEAMQEKMDANLKEIMKK
jgi:chaperonin cofactor prefoldin